MIKTTFHYLQFNCIMRLPITYFIIIIVALLAAIPRSRAVETVGTQAARLVKIDNVHTPPDSIDMSPIIAMRPHCSKPKPICIYELPISSTTQSHDWHRLWINTATLGGAFVGTLFVLELLPEDATNWNRASIQQCSPGTRWVMGRRQIHFQLRAASLCRSCLLHGCPFVRLQLLSVAALHNFNIHCFMGVRHRRLHGAAFVSGYIYHSFSRLNHGRMFLSA